ncbi:MAG: TRAP transporter permease [Rhodospirillales bacterium]
MPKARKLVEQACYVWLVVGGVLWVLDVPQRLGLSLVDPEWLGPYLGAAVLACFLRYPYAGALHWIGVPMGVLGLAGWCYMGFHHGVWLIDIEGATPAKVVPGAVAIVVLLEAVRKACGRAIAILVWALLAYGFVGHLLPPPFESANRSAEQLVLYVYNDTNGVPGLVLGIIATLVLAFILFGKLMELSGATQLFTDLSLAGMGHRRGGPAKVAIVASASFGMISGSTVGNIMSTGVVTIPLMKRSGFAPHEAAAVEAVASNGGQLAPPVMGVTAFLIAEFLQMEYVDVAIAAAVPALFYFICLFIQVDLIALRRGLHGVARSDLPRALPILRSGWMLLLPVGVLLYFLFFAGFTPAMAAVLSAATLFLMWLARLRRLPNGREWAELIFGSGDNMLPLLLIGAAAGVVIGVMNLTGLGFSISLVLNAIGESLGLFVMLVITAMLAIVLGMGMPTAAVYVVLSIILAPALVKFGTTPLAAHLFIFYFGMLSFLTPPVAVASYVAAGLAGANMWRTGWVGLKLSVIAYLLPFLWIVNPALILDGSTLAIALVLATVLGGVLTIGRGLQMVGHGAGETAFGLFLCAAGLLIGTATVWWGPEAWPGFVLGGMGVAFAWLAPKYAEARVASPL